MAPRLGDIKFNLLRAIELFQDMNDEDMDVTAPPSNSNFDKEYEIAQRLNDYLGQLIDSGAFDDCASREQESDEEGEEEEEEEEEDEDEMGKDIMSSTPRSEGFDYDGGSRESFSDRFKRYIRRIVPGRHSSNDDYDHGRHHHDDHHGHHDSRHSRQSRRSSSSSSEENPRRRYSRSLSRSGGSLNRRSSRDRQ